VQNNSQAKVILESKWLRSNSDIRYGIALEIGSPMHRAKAYNNDFGAAAIYRSFLPTP
jgi:hypothetical protein